MITKGIMEILHESIQIYDELCGKTYLIVFGKKDSYNFIELIIKQSSFWHLLGCKLDIDSNNGKHNTYIECKAKKDVSDKISSIHSFSEIEDKYKAIKNVFNFIQNAKQIRVGYTINCPEQYIFEIGVGNNTGIIGYDYPNHKARTLLFPKSAQLKAISKIAENPDKILMILSKDVVKRDYDKVEYEIKKDISLEIIKYLPDNIKI